MDLPVSEITVRSTGGRMKVRVRKGINFSFSIMFTADGRHLAATVDAGAWGTPWPAAFSKRSLTVPVSGVSQDMREPLFSIHRRPLRPPGSRGISVWRKPPWEPGNWFSPWRGTCPWGSSSEPPEVSQLPLITTTGGNELTVPVSAEPWAETSLLPPRPSSIHTYSPEYRCRKNPAEGLRRCTRRANPGRTSPCRRLGQQPLPMNRRTPAEGDRDLKHCRRTPPRVPLPRLFPGSA